MVKGNQRRHGRQYRKLGPKSAPSRKFSRKPIEKQNLSVDQLDKELEQYWGEEVAHKHLDLEMDDYWKNKPS